MKIIQNPDEEFFFDLKRQIKENNGYCISADHRDKNTKCRCKAFKEQVKRGDAGACQCGLWIAVDEQ